MLSRVAESLFWIGRYVERAEDTARLLDVHFHEVLEDPTVDEAAACAVLLTVMGVPDDVAGRHGDSQAVLELLGYDDAPNSIAGALVAARQNARGVREALSAEIWQCLNSTHNALPARVAAARDFGPAPFFTYVRECAATFAGHVEASMSRDASYDALVLGRSLERVDMTARLLAARIGAGTSDSDGWTSTLRACSAHEAYLRTYHQGTDARRVLEFLLVDRLFPRSVFHALCAGEEALTRLDPALGRSALDEPARRAIGRARTDLEFLSAATLLDDLVDRLHGLQRTVSTISEDITRRLFTGSTPLHWHIEEPAT